MSFKIAKACVAVFSAAIAFGVLQARAQPAGPVAQPSAAPSYVSGLPVNPPQGWGAESWARLRQQCKSYWEKRAAKTPLSTQDLAVREVCIEEATGASKAPTRPAAPPQVPEEPGPNLAPPPQPPPA